ncbi:EcsC family protein [Clostridium sp. MD294]|uniref:EcsC family protein n=1 Tax=Clostridium sp. MD294 TaxID=97138 RepID=UPI001A9A2453|nr:EcsC family protein [Clostridium sp. MD294]
MKKNLLHNRNELQNALEMVMDYVISTDLVAIENYVNKLYQQNVGITCDELAKKVLSRKSVKNGVIGAITGIGGIITLPVAVPVDLVCSWRIQASMALSIAYIYGHTKDTTDLKTDLYLILAGDSAKEILKQFGIEASKSLTKKMVNKYITREVMTKIWKLVGRKIITKAGEKSLTSFVKMVPLVGAPVGFTFDWASTQFVGNIAIKYYSK